MGEKAFLITNLATLFTFLIPWDTGLIDSDAANFQRKTFAW
jgi:hypothetical protein